MAFFSAESELDKIFMKIEGKKNLRGNYKLPFTEFFSPPTLKSCYPRLKGKLCCKCDFPTPSSPTSKAPWSQTEEWERARVWRLPEHTDSFQSWWVWEEDVLIICQFALLLFCDLSLGNAFPSLSSPLASRTCWRSQHREGAIAPPPLLHQQSSRLLYDSPSSAVLRDSSHTASCLQP